MGEHLTEESLWASGLAARLRLILSTFADDPPDTRKSYLAEEIERSLKNVVPSKKQPFLAALGERFPAWQASAADSTAPANLLNETTPETPETLLNRLLEAFPNLTPEEQISFGKRLKQVLPSQAADFSFDLPMEYQKKLGLPAGEPLNPERVIKLLAAFYDITVAMDQLVWALWKQVAPQSNIRKEGDFAKLVGRYLVGDTEVSTQQLTQLLERTRKLNASLLGASGRASSSFAKKFVGQFAPEVIEDLARIEKGFAQSLESVSWKKYVQLAKEYASEPVIENEIQKAIARAAEKLMVGGPNT